MTVEERQELKEKIQEAITKTQAEIHQLEEATQPISPENSIGRVSRMDAINNKSVAEATLRTAKRKLNSLHTALGKIDAAEFGQCAHCGGRIPTARLMYMPGSAYCVRCADRV